MKHRPLEKIKFALRSWLARRMSNCKTVTPMLGQLLDRDNSFCESVTARFHLIFCEACRRYFDQIRFLSSAMTLHEKRLTDDCKSGSCIR